MLTKLLIDNVKPDIKTKRLADGRGMYLEVDPSGGRWWRFKYRMAGRYRRMSLGVYPEVSLALARDRREEARKMIGAGIDPAQRRRVEKSAIVDGVANTFESVGREWFALFSSKWAITHSSKVIARLENDLYPWIGKLGVRHITPLEVLTALRRIDSRGAHETARRALQDCGRIFRYAVATGRADSDPSRDLNGALPPRNVNHFASITEPKAVGALMRAIDGYEGTFITRCALRLSPLVFLRPGELRKAEWAEIDFDKGEWRIPAVRMKMREQHIVPLSRQAVEILRDLYQLTGRFQLAFPSVLSHVRPISENTINTALRRMGYAGNDMTAHGFRSMASTLLNERGWNRDAIERQLAHGERDAVRAAYNYAQHLAERRLMMQAWGDYLDELKEEKIAETMKGTRAA